VYLRVQTREDKPRRMLPKPRLRTTKKGKLMILTKKTRTRTKRSQAVGYGGRKFPKLSREEKNRYYAEILANCDLIGDCWIWHDAKPDAYINKRFGKRLHTISRFMLAYDTKESLDNDESACHKPECLSKACCNPDHLFWGTYAENCEQREADERRRAEVPAFLLTADPAVFLPIYVAMLIRMTPLPMNRLLTGK
jgi:hypothetical protein